MEHTNELNKQKTATNIEGMPPPEINASLQSEPTETETDTPFEAELPTPVFIIKTVDYDSRYYNQLGFYCALDTVEDPNQKFRDLLQEQKDHFAEERKSLLDYFTERMKRFSDRIKNAEADIKEEYANLSKHLKDLPQAIESARKAEEEKNELEEKVTQKNIAFGQRKENLIGDAIEAVRRNLESIIDNYRRVYEQRFDINRRTFEDNQPALAIKTRQFEKSKEQAESQWNRLLTRMEQLDFDGINPALSNWFFYLGLTIATVCGAYFFSIFALSKSLNDANLLFFMLTGFEKFIHEYYTSLSTGWRFLALTGWFIVLSLFLTVVSWLCWLLLRYLGKGDKTQVESINPPEQNFQFEIGDERELTFELKTRGGSFYHFWLQILPVLFGAGLLFFLVLLGQEQISKGSLSDTSALEQLDISLTGAVVGVLLTLLFGALFAVYIVKIVEPRNVRAAVEGRHANLFAQNIELVLAGTAFLISLFLLFFLKKSSGTQDSQPGVIATYAVLVMANGYLLGLALRLRSMFATINYLERKILALATAIRENSRPRPLNLTSKEDNTFRKEYFRLQRELFNLVLLKTQLGNQALGGQNAIRSQKTKLPKPLQEGKAPHGRPFWQRVKDYLFFWQREPIGLSSTEEQQNITNLEDWETKLYPAEAAEIEHLSKELARTRAQSREANEWVIQLKEERTPYCIKIRQQLRRLYDSINNFKRERERIFLQKNQHLRLLTQYRDAIQADIREGFNLGIWLRSEVGPEFSTEESAGHEEVEPLKRIADKMKIKTRRTNSNNDLKDNGKSNK